MPPNHPPPFRIELDERTGVPYYRQIIDQILLAIADGRLAPGDRLPTVRSLAVDLAVNPNTIAKAYRELEIVNVIETQQGSGTFVASRKPKEPELERRRALDRVCGDLVAAAAKLGFSLEDVIENLRERQSNGSRGNGSRRSS
jgi:GntR family transcriptional regulator